MNLRMGSQVFRDVQIPLLWGQRAVVQDRQGRLSVIDLSKERAHLEILADEPAPGIAFRPRIDGFVILSDGIELYSYNPHERVLTGIGLKLPECQINPWATRVGSNQFSGNVFSGFGVGIAVTKDGIALGAPVPPGLAKLAL
jgi:hypothetical protein